MLFVGLLSHMTPTVRFSQPLISLRRLGDNLLSQSKSVQLVKTETNQPMSVGYRQSLCRFILSLIMSKSRRQSKHWYGGAGHFVLNWCFVSIAKVDCERTHIGNTN